MDFIGWFMVGSGDRRQRAYGWCFNVNPSGFTALWFKQSYGPDASRLLGRLLQNRVS